jgi:type II secretory pathway predicted ATPase ExeA
MSEPACTGEPSAPHCRLSTPTDTRAINNLALQALIAALTINKTIVDETFARAAITEVTPE